MALTSVYYDGPVTETDRAQNRTGAPDYGVYGVDDFKVTAHPSIPYAVLVKAGKAHGFGVTDTAAQDEVVQCVSLTTGQSRWDLIVLRRNWQPAAGGPSTLVAVQAGGVAAIPSTRKVGPGVEDDQPLFFVKWQGGTSAPVEFIDLRVWTGNGGLYAKSDLVRTYMTKAGAEININGITWHCQLGVNDALEWVSAAENDIGTVIMTDTNWGYSGGLMRAVGAIRTHVQLSLRMVRLQGGNFTLDTNYLRICNLIPSGWAPGTAGHGNANVHTAPGVFKFTAPFVITSTGDLLMQVAAGTGTINTGDYFQLDVGWHR